MINTKCKYQELKIADQVEVLRRRHLCGGWYSLRMEGEYYSLDNLINRTMARVLLGHYIWGETR